MPVSVTMPRLGESVTEGTVTRWLKQEGERVEADEPLLEVSTDKVDTEIPSPATGVLHRIVVHEDETAEVGSELAVISGDGDGGGDTAGDDQAGSDQAGDDQAPAEERATVEEERPAPAVDEPSTEKPADAEAPAPQAESQPEPQAESQPAQQPESPPASQPGAGGPDGAGQSTVVSMPALG